MTSLVSLSLQSLTDMEGRIVSLGHGFSAGDIAAGSSLMGSVGGVSVPLQMNVLSTWPDGSVKHAILSFETPDSVSDTATLDLETVLETAASHPDIATLAAAQDYDFTVTVDGETVDVAALIQNGPVDLWQSGDLVTQGRVTQTLANGLELRADVTVKADGTIDTSITIGNDNVETTGLDALTYAVEIKQDAETVFENPALTQYHFTVWREKFSTEESANTVHVVYDMDYLRGTGLLPSVDTGLTLADGDQYGEYLDDPNATYDPLELGGIDNHGGIDEDRGRSGASKSYGVVTDDQHSYLVTQSAESRAGMLALTDQYGAFSDFYRNPETGEAYLLEDTDFNSFYTGVRKDVAGTDGVVDLTNDGLALRNKQSHDPSTFYTSYLVTGDRFYADGLASEGGSSHLLWKNAATLTADGAVDFGDQLRAQAWGLRDLFYAATLAPDGSHAKPVLEARLEGALQDYLDYYVSGETLQSQLGRDLTGSRETAAFSDGPLSGVLQSFNGTALDRPYWQDWFGTIVGQIAMTDNETARALGEWMANFSAGRFLQDDFDPTNSLYSLTGSATGSREMSGDVTWAELQALAEENGVASADDWEVDGFFTASAWGGNAALFSGTRDARYAEALLWMTGELSQQAEDIVVGNGSTVQLANPVQFLDNSIAGITDRTVGTDEGDIITDGDGNRFIAAGDGDDTVTTGAGNHFVDGGDGNDAVVGGAGEDWLFGGSGEDRLSGGAGVNILQGDRYDEDFGRFSDTFVFEEMLGETDVLDFTVGQDRLELTGFADLRRFGDVLSAFTDTDDGAVLDKGDAGRLLLRDVSVSDLSAADLIVNGPNERPIVGDDHGGTLRQGDSITLAVADLLANDLDPDGDPFDLVSVDERAGGTAVLNTNGTITFTAAEDFVGPATFAYTVRDDLDGEGEGIVTLEVERNGPPIPVTTNTISASGWLRGTDQNDDITPLDNNVRVFGRGGDDLITLGGSWTVGRGGSGDDTIVLEGARHYAWGNGGADSFVVKTGSTKIDIIDFDISADSLYFANGAGGLDSLADIQGAMAQVNNHTVITLDDGWVRLRNVDMDDLGAAILHTYQEVRETTDSWSDGPPIPVTTNTISAMGWLHGTGQNDDITPLENNVRVFGRGGDDLITLGGSWTVARGGLGDDTIVMEGARHYAWGNGGADSFVVKTGSTKIDIIDFDISADSLYFANGAGGLDSLADIQGAMTQVNNHTVITMEGGWVRLRNVDMDDLGAAILHTYQEVRETADTFTLPDPVGATISGGGWLNGTDENDMIVSGGGNVRLSGSHGDDHLIAEHWNVRMQGGSGDDVLESRSHDAILRGDSGSDTFLFTGRVDGRVQDFNIVEDRLALDIEGTGIADYGQLLDRMEDGAKGVDIVSDNGDRLSLEGVDRDAVAEDMFLFV